MHSRRAQKWIRIAVVFSSVCSWSGCANAQAISTSQQAAIDSLKVAAPALAAVVPAPPTSFIADVAHVLPKPALDSINDVIRTVQRATMGDIAVAIIPSVAANKPQEVALATFRTWRVGRVIGNGSTAVTLGTLLLIVPKESAPDKIGRCWVTTGRGMESILSDTVATDICANVIIPYLKKQDYPAGIRAGVNAIADQYRKYTSSRKQE